MSAPPPLANGPRALGTGAVLVMIGQCSIWGMGPIAIKVGN